MKTFLTSLIVILLLTSCHYEPIPPFYGVYELRRDFGGEIYFHDIKGEMDLYLSLPPFFPQEEGRVFFIIWRNRDRWNDRELLWWRDP
jgi:hypothetical protein